jgi:hypothetical protein
MRQTAIIASTALITAIVAMLGAAVIRAHPPIKATALTGSAGSAVTVKSSVATRIMPAVTSRLVAPVAWFPMKALGRNVLWAHEWNAEGVLRARLRKIGRKSENA